MKMQQRLALLLGGLLSVSSLGCAALEAVTSESTSRPGSRKASAQRMVSIARVFENQGRLEQAEVMYRKAQRLNPTDETVRSQLQQLAERRSSREFQANSTSAAIARADAVTGRSAAALQPVRPVPDRFQARPEPRESASVAMMASHTQATGSAEPYGSKPNVISTADLATVSPAYTSRLDDRNRQPDVSGVEELPGTQWLDAAPLPPVDALQSPEIHTTGPLTAVVRRSAGDIHAACANPDEHVDLLMEAVHTAESVEIRTLAATLLGECRQRGRSIRECLSAALLDARDDRLILAIADSQIQRGETTEHTARLLAGIASSPQSGFQVQAATSLMHFAGTSTHTACADALMGLLISEQATVRAAAAATLGDFACQDQVVLAALTEVAAEDPDLSVRESARSAIARQTAADERAEAVIKPRHGG